ncbi:MAG: M15 family metallopeptidase [Oscillospiraceae bacterium]|nr:M15 family metallopeptidase [Oscillospiraceae bacterium]
MIVKEKKNGRKSAGLTIAAILLLLTGVGIQIGLGVWQYRQSCETAGAVLTEIRQAAELQAESERSRLIPIAENGQTQVRLRLEKLAARKGRTLRNKHLELLLLVNPWNKVPEGYVPELAPVSHWNQMTSGYEADARCTEALTQMLNDCMLGGGLPYVCSAYRTQDYQQMLFDDKIDRLLEEGVSPDIAPTVAARSVAIPGTSEHQLGLALDIIDENYPGLNEAQEWTPTQQWLMKHCWEYGFILRYPNGTSDITGIIYEPWHYRYVGTAHAQAIHERELTLEEYLAMRRGR